MHFVKRLGIIVSLLCSTGCGVTLAINEEPVTLAEEVLNSWEDQIFWKTEYAPEVTLREGLAFQIEGNRVYLIKRKERVVLKNRVIRELSQAPDGRYYVYDSFSDTYEPQPMKLSYYYGLNCTYVIPSLGTSLISLLIDQVTLPFRLRDTDFDQEVVWNRWQRPEYKPFTPTGTIRCGQHEVAIKDGRGTIPYAALRAGPWESLMNCEFRPSAGEHPAPHKFFVSLASVAENSSSKEVDRLKDIGFAKQDEIKSELKNLLQSGLLALNEDPEGMLHPRSDKHFCRILESNLLFLASRGKAQRLEALKSQLCIPNFGETRYEELRSALLGMIRVLAEEDK